MNRRIPSSLFASRRAPRAAGRGLTLIEILVAVAISMTFLGGLYTAFIQVLQTSNEFGARQEALRNARTAVMTIADELKSINSGTSFLLLGLNNTFETGDGKDNDLDGRIDEEVLDGFDNDGDYDPSRDDNHASIGALNPLPERFMFSADPASATLYPGDPQDFGDFHVDEDVRFGNDSILFNFSPSSPDAGFIARTVTYSIGELEGIPNVLIRQAVTDIQGLPSMLVTAPIAFGVLGLDFLYWDPNRDPNPGSAREDRPYWVEEWRSFDVANFDPPRLPLPASILAVVTIYADPRPIDSYTPGDPVEVLRIPIIINVEDIIGDALYPRPIL